MARQAPLRLTSSIQYDASSIHNAFVLCVSAMFFCHLATVGLFLLRAAPAMRGHDPERAHELDDRLDELFRNVKHQPASARSSTEPENSVDEDVLYAHPGRPRGDQSTSLSHPTDMGHRKESPPPPPPREHSTSHLAIPMPVPPKEPKKGIANPLGRIVGSSLPPSLEKVLGTIRSTRPESLKPESLQRRPDTDRGTVHTSELSFSEYLKKPEASRERQESVHDERMQTPSESSRDHKSQKSVHDEGTRTPSESSRDHKSQMPHKDTHEKESQTDIRHLRHGSTQTSAGMSLEREQRIKHTQAKEHRHRHMQTQTKAGGA